MLPISGASPIQVSTSVLLSIPAWNATSLSNGDIPPEPPGFATAINRIGAESLSPLGVYITAVSYFHEHQSWAWTLPLSKDIVLQHADVPVTLVILRIGAGPAETSVLNNGHVLLSIYAAIVSMSESSSFVPTRVDVILLGTTIGEIFITTPQLPTIKDGVLNSSAQTSADSKSPIINSSSTTSDSGCFYDPEHPSDKLDYTSSNRRINSKDIFTSILQAFMILAYAEMTIPFTAFNAVSATGNLALNVHALAGVHITYAGAGSLLLLLTHFYVQRKRFYEIEFIFWSESRGVSVKQAEGFFFKVGNGGLAESADTAEV